MSEIPRCPFCGNKPEKVGAFSAQCRGLVDGKDIHNTIVMNNEAWNRRTPAPEGEAVAWGCFDANGLDDKMVYRDRRRAEDAAFAFTPSLTVNALYASPVVPVGVREEVEIIEDWLAMARSCQPVGGIVWHVPMCQTEIDAIAAILAALRPTDTGRE